MTDEMKLVVSFTDQSESFVLGFEAGQLWTEMTGMAARIDRGFNDGFPVHA